jgi:Ras association domain-containing protein 2/4
MASKDLLLKIRQYNAFLHGRLGELTSRDLNGRIVFEGVMRIYWGLKKPIRVAVTERKARLPGSGSFSEADVPISQYTEQLMKRLQRQKTIRDSQQRLQSQASADRESVDDNKSPLENSKPAIPSKKPAIPTRLQNKIQSKGQQSCQRHKSESFLEDNPADDTASDTSRRMSADQASTDVAVSRPAFQRRRSMRPRKISNAAALRPPNKQLGDAFVPPYGSYANLRLVSTYTTEDVVKMLLEKFTVKNRASEYALYIVHDHGGAEPIKPNDYPLRVRLKLGPSEDMAKIFIMDAADEARVDISAEMAQYINLAIPVLEGILSKYQEEEEREVAKIKQKYGLLKLQLKKALHHANGERNI